MKPDTPTSAAWPLALSAMYLRAGPVVTSVIRASPTLTWLSEMPRSPVAAGADGAPTIRPPSPANTLASPSPNSRTETRTVVAEPVGVTRSSSPFSREKLPAAYTKPATWMLAVPETWRPPVADVIVMLATPSEAATTASNAPV